MVAPLTGKHALSYNRYMWRFTLQEDLVQVPCRLVKRPSTNIRDGEDRVIYSALLVNACNQY